MAKAPEKPKKPAVDQDMIRELSALLGQLTEDQRQVLLLKFMENLNNKEVAAILGKPEGAVKSLQHRALRALKRLLEARMSHE